MSFGGIQPISQGTQINKQTQKSNATVSKAVSTPIPKPAIETQQPTLKHDFERIAYVYTTDTNTRCKKLTHNNQKQTDSEYLSVQIAIEHDTDFRLMLAIIYAESNFNPTAVSKNGAAGLMQVMPATARYPRTQGATVPK